MTDTKSGPETRPRTLCDDIIDLADMLDRFSYNNRAQHARDAAHRINDLEVENAELRALAREIYDAMEAKP
jgi:hypothetical protein